MKTKLLLIAGALISLLITACSKSESTVKVDENIPPAQGNENNPSAHDNNEEPSDTQVVEEEPPPGEQDDEDDATVEDYANESARSGERDISFVLGSKYGPIARAYLKGQVPEVSGTIEKRIIQKIIRQHSGELRACYDKAYSEYHESKKPSGIVLVAWDITPQGSADKIIIKESNLNKEVGKCIKTSIGSWRFPSNKLGETSHVEYPFKFEYR